MTPNRQQCFQAPTRLLALPGAPRSAFCTRCQPIVSADRRQPSGQLSTKWSGVDNLWDVLCKYSCQLAVRCTVFGLLLLLLSAFSAGTPQPSRVLEAGLDSSSRDASSEGATAVTVTGDHSFGQEGEVPTHLTAGSPGRLFALTDRALYLLDDQGRVLRRGALPVASGGTTAPLLVHAARKDDVGLGLTARWAGDLTTPAGTYLVLADKQGSFGTKSMIKVATSTGAARGVFDGTTHRVLWTRHNSSALTLSVTDVSRAKASVTGTSDLVTGLPAGTGVGGLAASKDTLSVCTLDPGGAVSLRRFTSGKGLPVVKLSHPGFEATGPCGLASSGRSHLLTYTYKALAPAQVDWGVADPDLGLGVTYPVPMAQVVNPSASPMDQPLRLSTQKGTVRVEDLLWDGNRYIVLVNTVGYRGGRLVLVTLDEAGQQMGSHTIPLAYEPGRLVAARMAATSSDLVLLYSTRKPWDNGVLHFARLAVSH